MNSDKHVPSDITCVLQQAHAGNAEALNEALRQMYDALHALAQAQLRNNRSERTLSATALVNEAYLKVFGGPSTPAWENRGHLLGIAAQAMREVLIDASRRRGAAKRPQDRDRLQLTEVVDAISHEVDYVALTESLDLLESIDPRQANIVMLRFFVGLTAEQIGTALDISAATVQREWRLARAWLQREMSL